MKRQVQEFGVKRWAAQDFLDLQGEPLKIADSFFQEYGQCIIQGCEISTNEDNTYNISSGLIALQGKDPEENDTFKVAPFSGAENVDLPVYFTLSYSIVERAYVDGQIHPIANDYKAEITSVEPEGVPFLELTVTGGKRFTDVSGISGKLDKIGDAKDTTVTFPAASNRVNISSGEKVSTLFSKVAKWFTDLRALAFKDKVAKTDLDTALTAELDGKEPAIVKNTAFNKNFGTTANTVCEGNDTRLSNSRPASGGNADTVGGVKPGNLDYVVAYGYTNGVLIRTTIPATADEMLFIKVLSNSGAAGTKIGIDTDIQAYSLGSSERFAFCGGINHGDIIGTVSLFVYDSRVYIHIPSRDAQQSFRIKVWSNKNTPSTGSCIDTITNAIIPNTGVTRLTQPTLQQNALKTDTEGKLDQNGGEAKDLVVNYGDYERYPLLPGEKLGFALAKIRRWLSDLHATAFSGDAVSLGGVAAGAFQRTVGYTQFGNNNNLISTATFITLLRYMGAFNQLYWAGRGTWSYAENQVVDTEFGRIALAGCVVEVFSSSGSEEYTIRVETAPTSNASGALLGKTLIYTFNGSGYAPGWRMLLDAKEYASTSMEVLLALELNKDGSTFIKRGLYITTTRPEVGYVRINHNYGSSNYVAVVTGKDNMFACIRTKAPDYIDILTGDGDSIENAGFSVIMYKI